MKPSKPTKTLTKPEWMTKKRQRSESSKMSNPGSLLQRSDSSNSSPGFSRSSKSLYLMSQKELLQIAQQLLNEGPTS
ncbi:hypothetical protein RRG08_009863 [Elysia crispata]|uniref:Uncharacterized protein n=1 Tax=Elysia crispata TaxID=231223 RepID=A0AAE0Z4G5_9GAST|nr:hypothetical protein RRG08_009863 [Elysia crispata]